jgi:hypothetical protein
MLKETVRDELNDLRRSIQLLELNQSNSSREPTLREFAAWLELKPDLGDLKAMRHAAENMNKLLKAFLCQEEERT